MKVITDIRKYRNKFINPVVAIGVFDGVHRGHQDLIKKAVIRAKEIKGEAIVLTFHPHPVHVLRRDVEFSLVVSLKHRLKLLEDLGVVKCIIIRFTKQFAKQSAEFFIKKYLVGYLGAKEVFIGNNFHFGKNKKSHASALKATEKVYGFKTNIVPCVSLGKTVISSSLLRRLITGGKLDRARNFLGRPVSILGTIIKGDRLGRRLGFPTANINYGSEILPPDGIYLAQAIFQKKTFSAIAYVGRRPSLKKKSPRQCEVYILNFSKNIYNKDLEVCFLKKIRSEKIFLTQQSLIAQMQKDKQKALLLFASEKFSY